jgi:hypothetical protein
MLLFLTGKPGRYPPGRVFFFLMDSQGAVRGVARRQGLFGTVPDAIPDQLKKEWHEHRVALLIM